jgi:hypothetical protein
MYLDGVNRFIALLAERLKRLGQEVEILALAFKNVEREKLEEWFREMHGLDTAITIRTLHEEPCKGYPWVRIAFDWLFKGSKVPQSEDFDVVIVSGVIPLRFRPKVAVIHDLGPAFTSNKFYVLLGKIILKHFNEIICVSIKNTARIAFNTKTSL